MEILKANRSLCLFVTSMLLVCCLINIAIAEEKDKSDVKQEKLIEDGIPNIVLSGLKMYKEKGSEAALGAWLKNSPLEGEKSALSQSNVLKQIESFYGRYTGHYHLISSKEVSPTVKVIYIQMDFQKGPLFCSFICYGEDFATMILPKFDFHTDIRLIFPESYYSDEKD